MISDIIKKMQPLIDATNFFSLPDGETKGFFYKDKDGQSIDCNIYHPKYGKQYEATLFKSVHYEDARTGKKITCLNCFEILCVDENDIYTNKDGVQIFKKEVSFAKSKIAETEKDFEIIYKKELEKSGSTDEAFFKSHLLEIVTLKEQEYRQALSNKEKETQAQTLELFYRFKRWLNTMQKEREATLKEIKSKIKSGNKGFVYIMRNASHETNIFKVGLTKGSTKKRAKQLSSTTGSPDKFLIAHEFSTIDCVLAEKLIHNEIDEFRLNDRREFFRMDFKELLKIAGEIIEKINKQDTVSEEQPQYHKMNKEIKEVF